MQPERQLLWKSSKVFAPDFPRNSSDDGIIQAPRRNREQFCSSLSAASSESNPGYYSVYSFPRGHPKDGAIPKVDCIFIDLDVTCDEYQPNPDKAGYCTDFSAWVNDMSALLARTRMIADAILDAEQEDYFRATLSGHKGVHLYLDFPVISPQNGDLGQFKNGLKSYGESIMDWLDQIAGGVNIQPWVDVDGSDLARLARHPNTRHHGAKQDGGERWCVPVTIEELSNVGTDEYLEYTGSPRWPDIERRPKQSAHDKAVQNIRSASSSDYSSETRSQKMKTARGALKSYRDSEHVNSDMTLDDVLFLVENKPCFKAFRERDDAYKYGSESRTMELSIMGRLLSMGTPVDVIHEFFGQIPGYDEDTTDEIIGDLLARNNEYGEFNCETILANAPRFCLGSECSVYNGNPELQK